MKLGTGARIQKVSQMNSSHGHGQNEDKYVFHDQLILQNICIVGAFTWTTLHDAFYWSGSVAQSQTHHRNKIASASAFC